MKKAFVSFRTTPYELVYSPLLCMYNESFPEQIPLIVMFTSIKDWVKTIIGGHFEI